MHEPGNIQASNVFFFEKRCNAFEFFLPTLPVSHLAEMHDIDSKLLVAVHFLSKEEQEELVKTAQPRMLIEGREEKGESEEALLPTGLFSGVVS